MEVMLCVRGVLSPILANIYLDALDQELEKRGLEFSRYADDCNIYVSSRRAAERVLASITQWIEKHLRLKVWPRNGNRFSDWKAGFDAIFANASGFVGTTGADV
jgi:RNA-directed DNA polymerase